MYSVYQICNIVNQKVYVGVTKHDLTDRLREHLSEAKRDRAKHRKLYKEINLLGADKFYIECICNCQGKTEGFTLEKAYIKKLGTALNGLNESLGGAGKTFVDPDDIYKAYMQNRSVTQTAAQLHCCIDTVRSALKLYNVSYPSNTERCGHPIEAIDVQTGQKIYFASSGEAGRYCEEIGRCKKFSGGTRQKIINAANGQLKTAYGFYWHKTKQNKSISSSDKGRALR